MKVINAILLIILFTVRLNAQQPEDDVTTISIKAITGLQFDVVRFHVKPGAKVNLIFTNADDMSHNLLITKPGTRLEVVDSALKLEERAPELNYIPKSSQVLWSIPVLSPNQTKSLTFTAPSQAGAYPYVCTYPGHGFVMYGVMYVSADGKMPDIKNDPNIPPSRKQDQDVHAKMDMHSVQASQKTASHPYEPIAPYLYRIFMDDASPAAIAVSLPSDLSYCWDPETCSLIYAWNGGFIDNTELWKGHRNANAKIIGSVFYRENTTYPLRIGNLQKTPIVKFKGYRLINRYPEFHYTIDGVDVFELILPKKDGNGLIRTFKIPNANKIVCFYPNVENESAEYEFSAGKLEQGVLKLTAKEAMEFTVTMTNYSLVYARKKK